MAMVRSQTRARFGDGARHILEEEVQLSRQTRLVSFVLYVQRDPQVRVASLRELVVELDKGISKETGKMFAKLFIELAKAENAGLRHLTLDPSERILRANRTLPTSIASLTSLTSLSMSDIGPRGSKLLGGLRSSLRRAELAFTGQVLNSRRTEGDWGDLDPIRLLSTSKDTLESLKVTSSWFTEAGQAVVYPRMVSLTVEDAWLPSTPILHRAFPNLSEIQADHGAATIPSDVSSADWRAASRAYQHEHGSWRELQHFEGSSDDLYLLSPLCRIRRIAFTHVDGDGDASIEADVLHDILSDTRPSHLGLVLFLNLNDNLLNQDWTAALFEHRIPPLQILHIELQVSEEDGWEEVADLNEALVSVN